jgi:hypothetical protein
MKNQLLLGKASVEYSPIKGDESNLSLASNMIKTAHLATIRGIKIPPPRLKMNQWKAAICVQITGFPIICS